MLADSLANHHRNVKDVFCNTMLVYRLDSTKVMMLDKNREPIRTGLSSLQYCKILDTEGSGNLFIELCPYQEPRLQIQIAGEPDFQFQFFEFPESLDELKGALAKGTRIKDASTISLEMSGSGLVDAETYDVIRRKNNAYTLFVMEVTDEPHACKRQKK